MQVKKPKKPHETFEVTTCGSSRYRVELVVAHADRRTGTLAPGTRIPATRPIEQLAGTQMLERKRIESKSSHK